MKEDVLLYGRPCIVCSNRRNLRIVLSFFTFCQGKFWSGQIEASASMWRTKQGPDWDLGVNCWQFCIALNGTLWVWDTATKWVSRNWAHVSKLGRICPIHSACTLQTVCFSSIGIWYQCSSTVRSETHAWVRIMTAIIPRSNLSNPFFKSQCFMTRCFLHRVQNSLTKH